MMLYLIEPDGPVNLGYADFRKMAQMTMVHVLGCMKLDTSKEKLDRYWSTRNWLYNYEAEP